VPAHGSNEDSSGVAFGTLTILITLAGWTVTPLFIEYFTADIDIWTSNGWRYSFAALCWLPLLVGLKLRGKMPAGLWKAALVPALINSAAQVAFTMSFYEIDPALVAFGLRSQMVFTALGAFLLFPAERALIRSPVFIAGLLAVIVRTGWTLLGKALAQTDSALETVSVFGGVLALAAGAGFACYALAVRKCMNHLGSMVSFAAISQITAGAQLVLMFIFAERHGAGALDLPAPKFGLLLLSAVIGIALGHVFYYISIKRLGVTVSTGVIQLQPFTVAALSYWYFSEQLSTDQWITGTVAVLGAVAMLVAQQRILRKLRTQRELVRAMEEETDPRG